MNSNNASGVSDVSDVSESSEVLIFGDVVVDLDNYTGDPQDFGDYLNTLLTKLNEFGKSHPGEKEEDLKKAKNKILEAYMKWANKIELPSEVQFLNQFMVNLKEAVAQERRKAQIRSTLAGMLGEDFFRKVANDHFITQEQADDYIALKKQQENQENQNE